MGGYGNPFGTAQLEEMGTAARRLLAWACFAAGSSLSFSSTPLHSWRGRLPRPLSSRAARGLDPNGPCSARYLAALLQRPEYVAGMTFWG